jgi:Uma2 family endonuclease
MHTLDEIRQALKQLTLDQRLEIETYLSQLDGAPALENQVREARPAYAASHPSFMTLEEFLEFEEKSPLRHEFINGVIFAMNGATVAHQRLVRNFTVAISNHLKRGPCEVFSSGLKLVILRPASEISYYPDVIVDCRPDTRDAQFVRDPRLIVEVLSPSTQIIDKREKLQNYRLIDSVEEYVIAAHDERLVMIYPRAERWKPRVYGGLDAAVELRSIELSVPMSDLYWGIPGG